MSLKYGVSSFLVLCLVLFLILKNYGVWTERMEILPQRQETKQTERKVEDNPAAAFSKDTAPIQSSIFVAEKNIFSPERKDFPIQASAGSKPVVRPQVVLYGVTIAGDYQAASIVNPGRPLRKGERELMTIRIGEKVGEYKLVKISSDQITLEAAGDFFDVFLYDQKMPKKRSDIKTESKPAMITNIQPAPASPPAGVSTASPPPLPRPEPPRPTLPQTSTEASKTASPRESVQGGPTPPSLPMPVKPSTPPPGMMTGQRPPSFPPGSPALPGVPTQPVTPP